MSFFTNTIEYKILLILNGERTKDLDYLKIFIVHVTPVLSCTHSLNMDLGK